MTLYIVATPIGNLGDLTPRAVETLKVVDRVIAEDTRRTRGLLTHLEITGKPLDRFDAHSGPGDIARLVDRMKSGETVALVTDAGTPAVSDPGEALTRACILEGVRVVPIPGASAVLTALVGSGLAADAFRFVGFLPRQGPERRDAITRISDARETVILFEAPNRTQATLAELADATPGRAACVARELTKVHEEFARGTLQELATREEWIGEVVIVLGAHDPAAREASVDDRALDTRIDAELLAGGHAKAIAERLAAWSGRPKRAVYERLLARKQTKK
jgi:16S rRNA (cytidine1402-2'-O)-methyltransferase